MNNLKSKDGRKRHLETGQQHRYLDSHYYNINITLDWVKKTSLVGQRMLKTALGQKHVCWCCVGANKKDQKCYSVQVHFSFGSAQVVTVTHGWHVLLKTKPLGVRRVQNVLFVFGILGWRGPLPTETPFPGSAWGHGDRIKTWTMEPQPGMGHAIGCTGTIPDKAEENSRKGLWYVAEWKTFWYYYAETVKSSNKTKVH